MKTSKRCLLKRGIIIDRLDVFRVVRKAASASITRWVAIIEELYDGIPSISKSSRNTEHTLSKLKEMYPALVRVKRSFTRSIQRKTSYLSKEIDQETIVTTPKTPYIDRATLNAQRQANYFQAQEVQKRNSEDYRITELPITSASEKSLSNLYLIKDRSRRPTDEDVDLDLSHLKI
jgi:hypothetical protein